MTLRNRSGGQASVVCDINITPLIDVMLVLLVTLIVSLPMMTHAVKLDLPDPRLSRSTAQPEVIELDIDSDGTLVWNNRVLAGLPELEAELKVAARKNPQPEVHLYPDRHVKYDAVAQVLAAVQRNRVERMGFVNTGEFSE